LAAACTLSLVVLAARPATDATPAPEPTPPTAARARPGYETFRLINERNIFNASRSGRNTDPPREARRPTRVDAFGLVGTMSYAQGTFAFFDGSGSEYRKAVQAGGKLADFEVLEILPNAVKLQGGTNAVELRMGMQLRREEAGEWQVTESGESLAGFSSSPRPAGGPPSSPRSGESRTTASSGSADTDDILKRLMEKRERESR
jgi:hypothetical protein